MAIALLPAARDSERHFSSSVYRRERWLAQGGEEYQREGERREGTLLVPWGKTLAPSAAAKNIWSRFGAIGGAGGSETGG